MLFSLDPTPAGPDLPASPRKSPFTNADGKPLIRTALLSVPLASLADLKWKFWAPSTFQAEGGECHRAALLDSSRTGARTNPADTPPWLPGCRLPHEAKLASLTFSPQTLLAHFPFNTLELLLQKSQFWDPFSAWAWIHPPREWNRPLLPSVSEGSIWDLNCVPAWAAWRTLYTIGKQAEALGLPVALGQVPSTVGPNPGAQAPQADGVDKKVGIRNPQAWQLVLRGCVGGIPPGGSTRGCPLWCGEESPGRCFKCWLLCQGPGRRLTPPLRTMPVLSQMEGEVGQRRAVVIFPFQASVSLSHSAGMGVNWIQPITEKGRLDSHGCSFSEKLYSNTFASGLDFAFIPSLT